MDAIQNCISKLGFIKDINFKMMSHYNTLIQNNELKVMGASLAFLRNQKKRFYNSAVYEIDRLKKEYSEVDLNVYDDFKINFAISMVNTTNIDAYLLQLIDIEQDFIGYYLKIISVLDPKGAVYNRLVNHINEMRESLTMLERNVTHQQQLLIA